MLTKPRIRMQIVADALAVAPVAAAPVADAPAEPSIQQGRFHVLIIVEGIETGDKRLFVENGLTWRDLPLPLMAQDQNMPEHMESVLIGNIDKITRQGTEIHGWGAYLTEPGPDAARLIALVQSGELRGVSADIDDVEFELLIPTTDADGNPLPDPWAMPEDGAEPPPEATEEIDGVGYEVVTMMQPILRVTEGRVMGATVTPFPAFQEAFIEDDTGSLTAAGRAETRRLAAGMVIEPLVAAGVREANPVRFDFPEIPPREWFEVPEAPGPMPLTILDSGQVFGHLAVWGECHIGITGECVEAPPSPSNYARFHVGECPVDDGGRVSVGRLTFHTGHAGRALNAREAQQHYDDSGQGAADLVAVDGQYGIWVCGAARSTLTTAQVREVMSTPPSGDWRLFGNQLDMVAALCVNVPGFNTPRGGAHYVQVRKEHGMVASLILSHPAPPLVATAGMDPVFAKRVIDRIAASVGRTPQARIAELSARVHAGRK